MNENTGLAVRVIENATLYEVEPGDYIVWESERDVSGVTVRVRREGIAAYQVPIGDWKNENGAWITEGDWEGTTLTIHRPGPVKQEP